MSDLTIRLKHSIYVVYIVFNVSNNSVQDLGVLRTKLNDRIEI